MAVNCGYARWRDERGLQKGGRKKVEEKEERKKRGRGKRDGGQLSRNGTCTYVHSYNSGNVLNTHNSAVFLNTYDRVVVHNAVCWKVLSFVFNPGDDEVDRLAAFAARVLCHTVWCIRYLRAEKR